MSKNGSYFAAYFTTGRVLFQFLGVAIPRHEAPFMFSLHVLARGRLLSVTHFRTLSQYRQDIPIPNHLELLAISFVCKAKQLTTVFTPIIRASRPNFQPFPALC